MTSGNDENDGDLSTRQKYQKEHNKRHYAKRKANGVVSVVDAENRKISNKKYYEQQKEKRLRRFANGEGSSNLTTPSSNISQPFQRIPLQTMNTNIVFSAFHECQGSNTMIGTTLNEIHSTNATPRVETTQICSGLTHVTSYGNQIERDILLPVSDEVVNETTILTNSDVSQGRYEVPLRSTNIHQPSQRLLQRSHIRSELTHQTLNGNQIEHGILLPLFDEVMNESTSSITQDILQEDLYAFFMMLKWDNLDKSVVEILTRVLSTNPYVRTFRSLGQLGPLDQYRVTLNASVELDKRMYNKPTIFQVACIWIEGNDNITAYKRSIVMYVRSQHSQNIEHYFECYDLMSYVIFFPNGEPGWHLKIPRDKVQIDEITNEDENMDPESNSKPGRKTVTMREYYCYKFQIRATPNLILFGGKLLQQFVVDVYIKIETSRLAYCEKNQRKIRADLYQGIVDCVSADEVQPSRVGQLVVLPASFIGGPRDMRRRFLDAMTLVQDDGKPDIFLTMTCNPSWPEILEHLEPGQKAYDRPDVVARVFHAKLEDLKDQLFNKHIIGVVKAHVYVIEFQKRGLPHAYFLLIMRSDHKMINPDHYDKMVCTEILDPIKCLKMHEMVVKHMMHSPCGNINTLSPCMQGDPKQCHWRYPRQFNGKQHKEMIHIRYIVEEIMVLR
ncbi:uncharacterized protein Tco_0222178 [Tanacetum coccineum]